MLMSDFDPSQVRVTDRSFTHHADTCAEYAVGAWATPGFAASPGMIPRLADLGWQIIRAQIAPNTLVRSAHYINDFNAVVLSTIPPDDLYSFYALHLRFQVFEGTDADSNGLTFFRLYFWMDGQWITGADILKRTGLFMLRPPLRDPSPRSEVKS
jgi:hypothetical protein